MIVRMLAVGLLGFAPFAAAQAAGTTEKPGAKQGKAQAPALSQAELLRRRAAKRGAAFLEKSDWTTSFAAAKRRAEKEGKLVLVYCTRSYAPSPPCEQLESGALSSERFTALGEKVVLYCHIVSRVQGEPEEGLPRRLGARAVPFVAATDEAGRPVATFANAWSLANVASFVEKDVLGYAKLRDRATKGDKSAKADYLLRRIRLGHLRPAAIQKELEQADYLTKAQRQAIETGLADLEILEILARIDYKDPKSVKRAATRLAALKKAGRRPSARHAQPFWHVLLIHANATEDLVLFEEALKTIAALPGPKMPAKWTERMNNRLKAMRFMKKHRKRK